MKLHGIVTEIFKHDSKYELYRCDKCCTDSPCYYITKDDCEEPLNCGYASSGDVFSDSDWRKVEG